MATKVINSLTFGDTYVFTTPYATSNTAAGTTAKVASCTPNSNFVLEAGARVSVLFSAANSVSSPTLNVNSTGAKTIRFRGAALSSSAHYWAANSVVDFVYDGTYWNISGSPNNSTYSVNNATITLSAGTGLSGGGDFTTNQSSAETITFSLGDSGVTAGTYGPSANVTGNNNATMSVPEITVDRYGRITSIVNRTYTAKNTDTDTNTHYTTKLFATSSTGTAHAATTNGNTYLRLFDDSTARQSIKITGSGATSVTSDANGVITISSTDTNTDTNTAHAHTAGTGLTISGSGGTSGTTTYSANLNSTTSLGTIGTTSQLYAVGVDDNGKLCVNVPWTDNNTDTKVTQAAAITATTSASYPVMLGYSTATTAVTNTLNKSAKLLFNTGTGELTVGTGSTVGSGKLIVDGDIIAGGGSDNYGIHPKTSNYSTLGKSNQYWYKVYSATIYTNSIKKIDGSAYSFSIPWNNF